MQTRVFTSRKRYIMQELKFNTSQTERLDQFLRRELPAKISGSQSGEISNSKIRRLILAGAVQVNVLFYAPPLSFAGIV